MLRPGQARQPPTIILPSRSQCHTIITRLKSSLEFRIFSMFYMLVGPTDLCAERYLWCSSMYLSHSYPKMNFCTITTGGYSLKLGMERTESEITKGEVVDSVLLLCSNQCTLGMWTKLQIYGWWNRL